MTTVVRHKIDNLFGWNDIRRVENDPDQISRYIISAKGQLTRGERQVYVTNIVSFEQYLAGAGSTSMRMDMAEYPSDDRLWRIGIYPDGVDVVCLGVDSVDSSLEGHYDRIDDLPNWVKERLAVLSMMSTTPPTATVEGVGRRISANVYWVVAPSTPQASTSA